MAREHHLTVQRTARYYTLGELTDRTQRVWFCLHGFGQLAQYFSRKFGELDNGKTLIVVPEGLSRFYQDGEYRRVGASWLTREDREAEIRDLLGYLNALYVSVLHGREPESLHITLLGFSQGAATACRWLNDGAIRADRLILWAGFFPDGLRDVINPNRLTNVEIHYVYGRQDQYIEQMADAASYLHRLKQDVPKLHLTAYEGTHRIEPAVLTGLLTNDGTDER